MNVRFACPHCHAPVAVDQPGPAARACPACGHAETLHESPCVACGCEQLYRQKDFPQWLGLSLLAISCALFFVLHILYRPNLAWAVLLGSTAFDGLLYLYVGDVVVCYRCLAHYRGLPERYVKPFELAVNERYRQERIRRERLLAQQGVRKTGS